MIPCRTPSKSLLFGFLLVCFGLAKADAQSIWANGSAGDWNIASSWNTSLVPAEGTSVFITNAASFTVTYSSPMTATSVGSLTFGGGGTPTRNISASIRHFLYRLTFEK